jgi:peroxiredoxin
LPFQLLSDADLRFATALKLPMLEIVGEASLEENRQQLIKRVTLIMNAGKIVKVFYPVFPPDRNADETICWLKNRNSRQETQIRKLA